MPGIIFCHFLLVCVAFWKYLYNKITKLKLCSTLFWLWENFFVANSCRQFSLLLQLCLTILSILHANIKAENEICWMQICRNFWLNPDKLTAHLWPQRACFYLKEIIIFSISSLRSVSWIILVIKVLFYSLQFGLKTFVVWGKKLVLPI